MADPDDDYHDSGLTEADYERVFQLSWTWLGSVFLVVFITLSSLLYWFSSSMRANSNVRVREAVKMIQRFERSSDTVATNITPLTLEIEEIRINMEENRKFIAETLVMDSYPRKMKRKLKNRFLARTFYTTLPSNWKQELPPSLRKMKKKQDRQQIAQLRYRLGRVHEIVKNNRRRLSRIKEIRKKLNPGDTFQRMIQGYERTRSTFEKRLSQLESAMSEVDTSTFRKRRLPGPVFRALTEMLDPLSMMGLQLRRFSGLSSSASSLIYAEQALRDAERIDPMNPKVYYHLGRIYKKLQMGNVSNRLFLKSLRVSRGQSFARRDEIISRFEQVLEQNPDSSRAHYDVAFAYYENGQEKKALDHLLSVLVNECAVNNLKKVKDAAANGHKSRAMAMVDALVVRKCGKRSMVQTLAHKRIEYILEGETPYYRLTYF